jgi:hypothetical protein
MPGLNAALENDEDISLPPWMREQILATDPGVFAAEVEGFGERIRASLGALRAPALLVVGAAEDPEGEAAKVAALLQDVGHVGAFLLSERVLPHVLRVLREGFGSRL